MPNELHLFLSVCMHLKRAPNHLPRAILSPAALLPPSAHLKRISASSTLASGLCSSLTAHCVAVVFLQVGLRCIALTRASLPLEAPGRSDDYFEDMANGEGML
jgi:hypothetical protein